MIVWAPQIPLSGRVGIPPNRMWCLRRILEVTFQANLIWRSRVVNLGINFKSLPAQMYIISYLIPYNMCCLGPIPKTIG